MKQLKIYYKKEGGHYHCRVFIGFPGATFAKVGDLVFSESDWKGLGNTFAHSTIFLNDLDINPFSPLEADNGP